MSSCGVDAEGERIIADVLIAGFTHETSKSYGIVIPDEIIGVIFMFWFIDVCDEWDKSLNGGSVTIDGQCAKVTKDKLCSIFGKKSVGTGIFEWRLRFKTYIDWCSIGIIRDDNQTIFDNQHGYIYHLTGDGICLMYDGTLWLNGFANLSRDYCANVTGKGILITITLNMDENTIAYKIEDKQYEPKAIPLSIDKYRLIVSLENINDEIELL